MKSVARVPFAPGTVIIGDLHLDLFDAAHAAPFAGWLRAQHPLGKEEWVKLFRKTFKFTGGEITGEFLTSIGYLPSPHREDCPAYREIARLNPPWMDAD